MTDFAPIVEAFARAARTNRKVPHPMVVPHENAALSMAHRYTMVTVQSPQERRLAGAVASVNDPALARAHLERDFLQR